MWKNRSHHNFCNYWFLTCQGPPPTWDQVQVQSYQKESFHTLCSCDKLSTLHDSVASRINFGSSNLKCLCHVAVKEAQINTPPSPVSTRCLCEYVWFSINVVLYIKARRFHFGLVRPENIVPEVSWFIQMQLCKYKLSCYVLCREKRLFLSKQATFAQCFSNSAVISFNLLTEACRVLDVAPTKGQC